ncbi:MAG: FAD-dependent oxidoreductase, partial [Candidatus Ryanbacteria bacterium]|nr:FAD-dependent oxidoreductase [Candidatus Ryanbacteria bacterium]
EDYENQHIDLALGEEATSLDLETRRVSTSGHRYISFRKLLITTGGDPARFRATGAASRILRFQTLEDADHIRKTLNEYTNLSRPQALVVGGGFIGLEFIESAVQYGFHTNLFLKGTKYFGEALEEQGWELLRKNFEKHDVTVFPETEVLTLSEEEDLVTADTGSEKVRGHFLGLGIGLDRNLGIFHDAGLAAGEGIEVNEYLETSGSNVWAAGDVAEFTDLIFGGRRIDGTWTNAVLQGKVAGENMAGKRLAFRTVSTYSISNLGFYITLVGNTLVGTGMSDMIRLWPGEAGYERLFFRGDVLEGALLINRFRDKAPITRLIEKQLPLGNVKDKLPDPSFDVHSLLNQ